ncbi:hypothetical protein AB0D12_40475 [Streptomyces sp. NPDC048479]|uniref:MmyB family transcriptional regulator n=1 Tax=Streptomyces sp. NPDC048479 TaxID=3154725 RepID=UPI003447A3F9
MTGNELWTAVFGRTPAGRQGNVAWTAFTRSNPAVLVEQEELERFQRALVADLRITRGRYPHDHFLQQLVTDLIDTSTLFATMWNQGAAIPFAAERKPIDHPTVGQLLLDCDVLAAADNDLRIVAYTAPPASDTADKLQLLAVVGHTAPAR